MNCKLLIAVLLVAILAFALSESDSELKELFDIQNQYKETKVVEPVAAEVQTNPETNVVDVAPQTNTVIEEGPKAAEDDDDSPASSVEPSEAPVQEALPAEDETEAFLAKWRKVVADKQKTVIDRAEELKKEREADAVRVAAEEKDRAEQIEMAKPYYKNLQKWLKNRANRNRDTEVTKAPVSTVPTAVVAASPVPESSQPSVESSVANKAPTEKDAVQTIVENAKNNVVPPAEIIVTDTKVVIVAETAKAKAEEQARLEAASKDLTQNIVASEKQTSYKAPTNLPKWLKGQAADENKAYYNLAQTQRALGQGSTASSIHEVQPLYVNQGRTTVQQPPRPTPAQQAEIEALISTKITSDPVLREKIQSNPDVYTQLRKEITTEYLKLKNQN
jgi:hypothetical protein